MERSRDIFASDPNDVSPGPLIVDGGGCPFDIRRIIELRRKYSLPGSEGIVEQLARIGAPQGEIESVYLRS